MKFVSGYSKRDRVQLSFDGEVSLTHQSFAPECDINVIMARYAKTGAIDHLNERQAEYLDVVDFQDYQTSLNQVIVAQEFFAALPAEERAKFDNDPGQFLDFYHSEANRSELAEMGLKAPDSGDSSPVAASKEAPPTVTT